MALIYQDGDQVDLALNALERSLGIHRQVGRSESMAAAMLNFGWFLAWMGQHERAEALLIEAREVAEAVGDRETEVDVLTRLGALSRLTGDLALSRDRLGRALRLLRQDARYKAVDEAEIFKELARTAFRQGEPRLARQAARTALDLLRELDDSKGQAEVLNDLGRIDSALGEHETALAELGHAAAIFRRLAMDGDVASALPLPPGHPAWPSAEAPAPPAALREAQLALYREEGRSAPYYWAGFVLQGEWR